VGKKVLVGKVGASFGKVSPPGKGRKEELVVRRFFAREGPEGEGRN